MWANLAAVKNNRVTDVSDDTWMTGIGVQGAHLILDDIAEAANASSSSFRCPAPASPGCPPARTGNGGGAHYPRSRTTRSRTYTARAVRTHLNEVDVDFAVHGDSGPASGWALQARLGDALAILGPDAGYGGDHGGVEFRPPVHVGSLLIAGDKTAVPAIGAILERLPFDAGGEALREVPHRADVLSLQAPPGLVVSWLVRNAGAYGRRLVPAVTAAADRLMVARPTRPAAPLNDVDADTDILWEVPVAVTWRTYKAWPTSPSCVPTCPPPPGTA